MLSKGMLLGIILGRANFVTDIYRNDNSLVGYSIKVVTKVRGEHSLLSMLQDTLSLYGISASIKLKETKNRPRPILTITGIKNNYELFDMIPQHLIPTQTTTLQHYNLIQMLYLKEHLTLEGIETIMQMRGILHVTNKS
tara:strand:+ start:4439 stop:4855 length:417 start_codon:yes stop_codon:yes gene_type:complete